MFDLRHESLNVSQPCRHHFSRLPVFVEIDVQAVCNLKQPGEFRVVVVSRQMIHNSEQFSMALMAENVRLSNSLYDHSCRAPTFFRSLLQVSCLKLRVSLGQECSAAFSVGLRLLHHSPLIEWSPNTRILW